MGNPREFFNILLLSVSLATVLITLVSFIVFKLRYTMSTKQKSGLHQLEGSFFKRFAPHLKKENELFQASHEAKERKRMSPQKKLIITFSSITIFIFAFFSAENYFSFRKKIIANQKSAERIRELVQDGLLQKKQFNPLMEKASFEETLSLRFKSQLSNLQNIARNEKIVLVVDRQNQNLNKPNYPKAIKLWKDFFKRNQISYRLSGISGLRDGDVAIFAQLRYLSDSQKRRLTSKLGKVSMIFTGFAGVIEGPGKKLGQSFLEEAGLVRFSKNQNAQTYLPTQFVGEMGLIPGQNSSWYPLDQSFKTQALKEGLTLARTSGHNGEQVEESFRDITFPEQNTSWLLLDPKDKPDTYDDYYILAKIAQTTQAGFIEIANWKKAQYKAAFGISLDTEDHFDRVEKFMDLFEDQEIEASFYLVSDLMNEHPHIEFNSKNDIFEFGTHTNDHLSMLSKNLKEQFYDLEQSRFDIEARVESRVEGIRPPKEEIDEVGLSAIVQNGFSYIFESNRHQRFAPSLIANGELVLIPRTLSDDFEFHQNKFIIDKDKMLNAMKSELDWIMEARGAHFLSLHTQIAGEELAFNTIERFVKSLPGKGLWKAKTGDISSWWKSRSKIKVEFKSGVPHLVNTGNKVVKNFELIVHNPTQFSKACENRRISSGNDRMINEVVELKANSSMSLCETN
ncbi:MAG: polysaccharide deacetylase family protein [Bacteriovoracaceae bacterium]|nr:polysaccharide deacetylase family protein [Bacteriovoracaceae bacterium]